MGNHVVNIGCSYTGEEKAEIAKKAAVYGISVTIRHYVKSNS